MSNCSYDCSSTDESEDSSEKLELNVSYVVLLNTGDYAIARLLPRQSLSTRSDSTSAEVRWFLEQPAGLGGGYLSADLSGKRWIVDKVVARLDSQGA